MRTEYLTWEKIESLMKDIKPGDEVVVDSYAAAANTAELARRSVPVRAKGVVIQNFGTSLNVRFNAVIEAIPWHEIIEAGGREWPLYLGAG